MEEVLDSTPITWIVFFKGIFHPKCQFIHHLNAKRGLGETAVLKTGMEYKGAKGRQKAHNEDTQHFHSGHLYVHFWSNPYSEFPARTSVLIQKLAPPCIAISRGGLRRQPGFVTLAVYVFAPVLMWYGQ